MTLFLGAASTGRFWRFVLVVVLTIAAGFLVAWSAAKCLIVAVDLAHADALVVLAGSSTYLERTRYAAQLFNEGRAPRILLTNDNRQGGWSAEEERNPFFVERATKELELRGVPADKIQIVPGTVSTTHEEALRIREYAESERLRSIVVVTSAYQSRRALWTMRQAFSGSGIDVGLKPVEPGDQSPSPAIWWYYRLGWKMVPGEYAKILYYHLRY
jgi:uncharacterized SAM-binding protein YcdF (DUF218 family)